MFDKVRALLHGGDYNPDQWLDRPDILARDIELMKKADINCASVGIFAWSALEPEEGKFTFGWLADIIDNLYNNGIYTILATPSGARPAWMSKKYPEVLRVSPGRERNLHGARHNHCYTSPEYRRMTARINMALAERFASHPGVILWHISNEYGGECHCELCQEAFREHLKSRYKTLEALNKAWWTAFWSHTYTDWSQIESPSPRGETTLHGLSLDWKRFVTAQTLNFYRHERESVRQVNPELPATTNFMWFYEDLDYFKFKDDVDIVSWDAYPPWHTEDDIQISSDTALWHSLMRSIKNKPFLLMESTPSVTNWQPQGKLKRPGMHKLSSMQAIAHGSNSVQYFQWRKSRGSFEKFHGAVVDHYGEPDTRVFRDVESVGKMLKSLPEVRNTINKAEAAIIYDWENLWAVKDAKGPLNRDIGYKKTVKATYLPFWQMGIDVDFLDMDCDISKYKLVVCPMLYMLRAGFAEKLKRFVEAGGCAVITAFSGIVDENDLCFLGGMPGSGLREVFGVRCEETDGLCENDRRQVSWTRDGTRNVYDISRLCDLIHLEGAKALAYYDSDFYMGEPALTVNRYGAGEAYYVAFCGEKRFNMDFYGMLSAKLTLKSAINAELPDGVTAARRCSEAVDYIFLMNFNSTRSFVTLPGRFKDAETGAVYEGLLGLEGYQGVVLVEE